MPHRIFAFRIVQATLVVILANLLAACGSGPSTPSPTPSNGSAVLYAVGFGSPDGANGLDAFRIDPQTHGITSFSSAGLGGNGVPLGLFADKTGNFLLTAVNTDTGSTAVLSFKRNSDGTLTPATSMTIAGSGSSIAIDPQNRFFYVGTFNTTPVLNVLGFDSTSGALTPVPTFQLTDLSAMSADSSGNFLYVAFAGPAAFTSGGIAELSVGSDGTIMQKGSVSLTGARFPKALFADSSKCLRGKSGWRRLRILYRHRHWFAYCCKRFAVPHQH